MFLVKTCTADALSQAPIVRPLNQKEVKLTDDVQAYVDAVINTYLLLKIDLRS